MEIDILPPFNYHYKHRHPTVKSRGAVVIRRFSGLVATCITVCDYTLEDVLQDMDQGMGGM